MSPGATPSFDVVILAGGRGRRMGGQDKAALPVAGRPMLARVLEAAQRARDVVVVGQVHTPDGVRQVSEEPPGGGPVAGINAGVAALGEPAPWTCVLAVDQPDAGAALSAIIGALPAIDPLVEVVCHLDATSHAQWLLAAYRHDALVQALAPHGTGHGVPVGRLVSDLRFQYLRAGAEHVGDIDTWADHARWEQRLGGH
ncbi:molybdenum cofactor guanylyltransferase [Pseudactinotalea sp. Z1748]|uniref:molybdenum cofactor guanylyltransferase n=1 Tax=Pseudactinotalea sp. Z1748 TaxID=3413027 RepID=UPI003C7A72A3